MNKEVSSGVAHKMPADFGKALLASAPSLVAWENITPLARNEWICWMGCVHRTDKPISSTQKYLLEKQVKKSA